MKRELLLGLQNKGIFSAIFSDRRLVVELVHNKEYIYLITEICSYTAKEVKTPYNNLDDVITEFKKRSEIDMQLYLLEN